MVSVAGVRFNRELGMVPDEECQPLTLAQFSRHVAGSAMQGTLKFFNINWPVVAVGALVALLVGAWVGFPTIATAIGSNPSAVITGVSFVFAALILVSAHNLHLEDQVKWGGVLKDLRRDLSEMKAASAASKPLTVPEAKKWLAWSAKYMESKLSVIQQQQPPQEPDLRQQPEIDLPKMVPLVVEESRACLMSQGRGPDGTTQ